MQFSYLALRHIRRSLTRDITNTVACSIIHSRLDFCNSLLHGVAKKSLNLLQWVQNKLMGAVHNISTRYHSIDLLQELQWMPIHSWVIFKIGTLCYNALWHQQSTYLHDTLNSLCVNAYSTIIWPKTPWNSMVQDQDGCSEILSRHSINLEHFTIAHSWL